MTLQFIYLTQQFSSVPLTYSQQCILQQPIFSRKLHILWRNQQNVQVNIKNIKFFSCQYFITIFRLKHFIRCLNDKNINNIFWYRRLFQFYKFYSYKTYLLLFDLFYYCMVMVEKTHGYFNICIIVYIVLLFTNKHFKYFIRL